MIVEGADLLPRIETAITDNRIGDTLSWAPLISTKGSETRDSVEASVAASDVQTYVMFRPTAPTAWNTTASHSETDDGPLSSTVGASNTSGATTDNTTSSAAPLTPSADTILAPRIVMASPGEREADRDRMTVISEGLLQEQTSKDDSAKNLEQSPLCRMSVSWSNEIVKEEPEAEKTAEKARGGSLRDVKAQATKQVMTSDAATKKKIKVLRLGLKANTSTSNPELKLHCATRLSKCERENVDVGTKNRSDVDMEFQRCVLIGEEEGRRRTCRIL